MKRFKNILVSVDTRLKDHPVLDRAAALAKLNSAPLKVVEVVPKLDSKPSVPDQYKDVQSTFLTEKQHKLEELIEPFQEQGIQISLKLLVGHTSQEIIREVVTEQHDLVMKAAKGKGSHRRGYFGATAMRLLRHCPCAVWLTAPGSRAKYEHILACVSNKREAPHPELNQKVMELATSLRDSEQCNLSVLAAWSIFNEALLRSRSPKKDMEWIENDARQAGEKIFDSFLRDFGLSVESDNIHLVKDSPVNAISGFVQENHVNLVVMGTVARSGLRGLLMGNTAESVLDRIACSVLAIKPQDFKTRFKL